MRTKRLAEIAELVNRKKFCTTGELLGIFGVSPATLNRDLTELARHRRLAKVRGGAAAATTGRTRSDSSFDARLVTHLEAKAAAARNAFRLVSDGDIIFLDSSTTVYQMVPLLRESDFSTLTVVTNSLHIIQEFPLFSPRYFMIALGGNYDIQLNAFLGQSMMREAERLVINHAFFSAMGVDGGGVFSRHENHAIFLRGMLARARNRVLVATTDKFNRVAPFEITRLDRVEHVATEIELK